MVFISYSSRDAALAYRIRDTLENSHIHCWMAPEGIPPGSDYMSEIPQAIRKSGVFLLLLSGNSQRSVWVPKELSWALDAEKRVIPLHIDQSALIDKFSFSLGDIQRFEAYNRLSAALETLVDIIGAAIEKNRQSAEEKERPRIMSVHINDNTHFIGRQELLGIIREELKAHGKIFLRGIGGIGKSELARQLIRVHRKDYDSVIFLTFRENLLSTVINDSPDALCISDTKRMPEESEEAYFDRKLDRLRELASPNTLIVIDNYDVNSDDYFSRLVSGPYQVLFTTRNEQSCGFPVIDIPEMTPEEQTALFRHHYGLPLSDPEERDLIKLLRTVNGHTLTIELMAKLMRRMHFRPARMLDEIAGKGLQAVFSRSVDHESLTASAFSFVQYLFDISSLSEKERYVLINMSLMPLDGIEFYRLMDLIGLDDGEVIDDLIRKSWLRHDMAEDRLFMHPLIAQVVMAEEEPTEEKCRVLIENLSEKLRFSFRDLSDEEAYHLSAIVESLYSGKKELIFPHRRLWIGIQSLLCRVNKHKKAVEILTEIKRNCLENHDYESAASVLYLMHDAYGGIKDVPNALRCCEEGVAAARQGSSDELGLAYLLRTVASRSMDLPGKTASADRIRAALDEAVNIVNTTKQERTSFGFFNGLSVHLVKYDIYYIFAKYYIYIEDYQNALLWANRAYEIIAEHAENDEQRKFARASYRYMAEAYAMLGEKEKAREYIKKTNECWEGYFSPNHLSALLRKLENTRILHIIGDYEEEKGILEYAKAWLEERKMTDLPVYQSVLDQLSALYASTQCDDRDGSD